MNRVREKTEFVAMVADLTSGNQGDFVKITGDEEVDKCGPGDVPLGYIAWIPETVPGEATIETFFPKAMSVIFSETVQAGDDVKIGTADGNENQRIAKWISGTDNVNLKFGICWIGGAADSTGKILF